MPHRKTDRSKSAAANKLKASLNPKLTERQAEVYAFMKSYFERTGSTPIIQVVMDHFGWTSYNSVQNHYKHLMRKGYIQRQKGGSGYSFVRSESPYKKVCKLLITGYETSDPRLWQRGVEEYRELDETEQRAKMGRLHGKLSADLNRRDAGDPRDTKEDQLNWNDPHVPISGKD